MTSGPACLALSIATAAVSVVTAVVSIVTAQRCVHGQIYVMFCQQWVNLTVCTSHGPLSDNDRRLVIKPIYYCILPPTFTSWC